eukprot:Skav220420  [mRNA]  locus=scaffold639:671867:673685:+ [translate_table: standard]
MNRLNHVRVPNVNERELMLGFPLHYTAHCLPKGERKGEAWSDCRLTLLGNSWSVPVVAWLLNQLLSLLGLCPPLNPQAIMNEITPGCTETVQGRLLRLPLTRISPSDEDPLRLTRKLGNLISIKGEDLMLQASHAQQVKFQRLRAAVPSRLWRWRIVTGWQWRSTNEHINSLELRAILTSMRWRIEHKFHTSRRFLHLTDSLEDRAHQRRRLGTLRSLTVQPATKRRYDNAVQGFLTYLRQEGLVLPTNKQSLDMLVSDFLEVLWSSGKGRALACDALAGLQDMQPNLRGHLSTSWRLLKAWHANEIPNRAPPLPEHLLQAMVGWALFHNHNSFAVSLLIGFYGMLRTGELLQVRASHLTVSTRERQALLSLGFTKTGKRHGAAESVVLGHDTVFKAVTQWKKLATSAMSLTPCPAKWRSLFNDALQGLQITEWSFRPYSLRRGGANFWFQMHQNMDRILVQGRWHTQKSARLYINEGMAVLAQMQLPPADKRLKPFLTVFRSFIQNPRLATLEPPTSGRSGGRGSSKKKGQR